MTITAGTGNQPILAVTFDLDDTLWDGREVISRAEDILGAWLETHFPRIPETYSQSDLRQMRLTLADRQPEIANNLTRLRIEVLREAATRCGYDAKVAEQAFQVFIRARNDVTPFADVIPGLRRLAGNLRIGALTNGNADVSMIGLGRYFDFSISAIDVGVAKPHRDIFLRASQLAGVNPRNILHVGDDPLTDVCGARKAGLMSAWINRTGAEWNGETRPDLIISNLTELADQLLPAPGFWAEPVPA